MQNTGREIYLFGCLIAFIVVLIIIEQKSSIKVLLRLITTLLVLYFIYVKGVINKANIVILTVLVTFIISFINIFIKEGIHRKSFTELISVMITSLIIGGITFGISFRVDLKISYENEFIKINEFKYSSEVVFAIAVVALLGIYMDIISRITGKLDEEKDKAQDVTWKEQFKDGILIGRELISEKISMLFLLFTGLTLVPICLYMNKGYNFIQILNVNEIFMILIIAVLGNLGLVLTVPITSFVYAMLNRKKTIYKKTSENKIDGKRSLKL